MKNKIAFVVLSCDNYSDLWPMFIQFFEKNWPDCPFDKYFMTNQKSIPPCSFIEVQIGEDQSWSEGVIRTLAFLKNKYKYVLITLEDLPIIQKVNNSKFIEIVNEFLNIDGNYLKLIRKPPPTNIFNNYFGEIKPGSLYRPTCVYALWKIEILLEIMDVKENAWEFERFGSIRSDKFLGFYVVYNDFFKVINTVIKGKWVSTELNKLIRIGYIYNSKRLKINYCGAIRLKINTLLFNLFIQFIPWKFRRSIVFKLRGYKNGYNIEIH